MKTERKICNRLTELDGLKKTMLAYLEAKKHEQDWHGVEDAASDIRDLEAEERALIWVLA